MELHAQRPFPLGAIFWGCMTVVLLVVGHMSDNTHISILSLAPAMLAIGFALGRRREFHATLTEEGITLIKPPQTILYSEIEGLTIDGFGADPNEQKLRRGPVMVMHRDGTVEIPARMNVPVQKVYRAILAMLPTTGVAELSQEFQDHVEKETATFGPERVHVFKRRKIVGRRPSTRRGQICAALLVLCGVAWCLISAAVAGQPRGREYEPWMGVGGMLAIVSLLVWFWLFANHRAFEDKAKKLRNAELVVSPTGIAVKQGDLQGHLRWDELLDVRLSKRARAFLPADNQSGLSTSGIQVAFAGAKVYLADIYDRPVALIYRQIRRYWKGEE